MFVFAVLALVHAAAGAAVIGERAICADFCPENYQPVCGTDGKTYSNKCFMTAATCKDSSVTMDHMGACGSHPVTMSACPDRICIDLWAPVCGSDGKTYSNECDFHSVHCHNDVTVAHRGSCDGSFVVSN